MSTITWDAVGERFYETGTKHGVLYVQSGTSYPNGVAWNGLTGVTESPDGAEATAIYADDIKYLNLRSVENFKGTITAYTYPDEFAQCNGEASLATGVTMGQQSRKPFGFSYVTTIGNDTEFDDHGEKIHLVWGASVSPSEKAYKTINDSPEAIEFSWEFDTIPVAVTGHKPSAHMEIDSTKVNAAALTALKNALYGTENTAPYLPLPDEVLSILAGASVQYVYVMVSSPTGNPSTSDYYVRSGNDYIKSTDTSVVEGTVYYTREVAD